MFQEMVNLDPFKSQDSQALLFRILTMEMVQLFLPLLINQALGQARLFFELVRVWKYEDLLE